MAISTMPMSNPMPSAMLIMGASSVSGHGPVGLIGTAPPPTN
jgi:hypothetical protein